MKRSEFLASAGILSAIPFVNMTGSETTKKTEENQYVELIKYQLHVGTRQKIVSEFYRDIAIPALNKVGIKNVGVFNVVYGPNNPTLYVLIPHSSIEAVYTDNEKLLKDQEYLTQGDKFLNASIDDSPFIKMEKSLLRAFNNLPQIQIPDNLMTNSSRIYELRIYESASAVAARKKIHMFNEGGEIEIFKKTGLQPVFFGETIIGQQMPNLHYMLAFENMASRDKNWDQFRNHPDWNKLKSDPYYANTVSCITDIILKPTAFSQI